MLSGGDGEQRELTMGYNRAAWAHHRRELAVYTALAEGFFPATLFQELQGKKKKKLLKMKFRRDVLNSAIFSEKEGETLRQRCYT